VEPDVAQAAAAAEEMNFVMTAFAEGGVVMFFIAAIGILTILLVLERFLTLKSMSIDKHDFNEHLFGMILRGDVQQSIAFCDSKPAPLTNTLKAGLVQVMNNRPDEEVQVAMDASVLRESPRVEGWTGFLAVFGNLATLTGLTGTIIGMITSFKGVSAADDAEKAQKLSQGISEALNCTAFGLIVALIAILFFGYFQIRVSRLINDMQESSMSMMNLVTANRDKLKLG
jgi:biopolymer transport protein ExbB/TolQ